MKKHLTSISMFAVTLFMAFTLTRCGEEVSTDNPDGTVKETAAATTFSTSADGTRTSMDRGGAFYWTDDDHIFVYKDAKYIRDRENSVMGIQAKADFYLPGSYTDSSYKLYYVGQNSPDANSSTVTGNLRVIIPDTQSQPIPDDAEHLAVSGDCGIATATRNSDGSYGFTLIHKAAYLIFAPKDPAIEEGGKCKLKRVKVETTDGSTLCGTYTFDTAAEELNTAAGTGKGSSITLSCGKVGTGSGLDFPINPTQDGSKNAAFMVIEPGVHALKITYTVEYYGIDQDIEKTVSSRSFLSNHFYTVGHDLKVTVPEFVFHYLDTYYMWDAQKWYWWGQNYYPTVINDTPASTYPRSKAGDPQRWYNDIEGISAHYASNSAASYSCKDMPCYNAMTWYLSEDVYFDGTTEWSLGGIKQRGGLWLKKWSKISGKPAGATITNCATASSTTSRTPITGKPANTADYFFLPALGYYYIDGHLHDVGVYGYYWSSSPLPGNAADYAYRLHFTRSHAYANNYNYRHYGCVAGSRWFK